MRRLLTLVPMLLLTAALAGCSDGGGGGSSSDSSARDGSTFDPEEAGEHFSEYDLDATDSTGIIRGIVLDTALQTLEGATVKVKATDVEIELATDAAGTFGVDGLTPGTYFVQASKVGYTSGQSSVEVVANVDEPDFVTVRLEPDASKLPYFQEFKWEGIIECGLSVFALCSLTTDVPGYGNVTQDEFATVVPIEKPPQLVQSEMIWDTTQSVSDEMWMWHSKANTDGSYNGSLNTWAQGPSPLLMASNETAAEESSYGSPDWLYLRIFSGSIEGTRNPLDPNGCYVVPGVVSYCGGVGFTIEQSFTVYTHVFYGYQPPEGWRLSEDGDPPGPPL